MIPKTTSRVSRKRRRSQSSSLYSCSVTDCIWKLLIFLAAVDVRTRNAQVRAQSENSYCHEALYSSDDNGDGRVDSEEYVEFCRLRLEERLEQSEEGYTYDTSSAIITSFVFLPSGLQSNFYTLACMCSRFEFDDTISDKSICCVGENAHLSVVSVDKTMDDEESLYMNLVCSLTDRAIANVVSTMEIIESPPTDSPVQPNTNMPTIAPTILLEPTTSPTVADSTVAPTIRPTASPSMRTTNPTIAPTTATPTIRPTASPPTRTAQPTITSTSSPSISPTSLQTSVAAPSVKPTVASTTLISAQPSLSPTIQPSTMLPTTATTAVQPTKITITTSYSILVEEQQQMNVDDLFNIRNDCIEAMNILAARVSAQLWYDDKMILEESALHGRLFVELPTTVDQIEDVGFVSTPALIEKHFDSAIVEGRSDVNDPIFSGGPCPLDMEFWKDEGLQYSCLDVRASILLNVIFDDDFIEIGMSADEVEDTYSDALEGEILRGELADIFEDTLLNSTVIIATGQSIPANANTNAVPQTKKPVIRVGVIVGLVAGGLLLMIILVHLCIILRRRRQRLAGDEKQSPFASADTIGEEDLEARYLPSSGKMGSNQGDKSFAKSGSSVGNNIAAGFRGNSKVGAHNEHGSPNLLMNKRVPYFQTDASPGSIMSGDDAKSIGGISAESDAGWSEAYTSSSRGSASDDGIGDAELSPGSPTLMSLSMGPTFAAIDAEDVHGVSPMKESKTPIPASPTTPTSSDSKASINPLSPSTPKSIQLLEEATSDNDDEILIHEDSSDEDDDDGNEENKKSHDDEKESPEEFRARISALIERIVPEEIDQIDDMISQFKNREDELVETLLAMEKRAIAQKETEEPSPPSSSSSK